MKLLADGVGFAHLNISVSWTFNHPPHCTAEQIRYREMRRHQYGTRHIRFRTLDIMDAAWEAITTLDYRGYHARCGNHNWGIGRWDVTFHHPLDQWTWYGRALGGSEHLNAFFVRRTNHSMHLRPPLPRPAWGKIIRREPRAGQHPLRHKFKHPLIEPDDLGTFRVADGDKTLWFTKQFNNTWD